MTDSVAYGDLLDLEMGRNYNSRAANVDGPFGYGWSTAYLLDYNVTFDSETNSRPIDPAAAQAFSIGLDVTWAPRGVVTLTTATGSRHQFVFFNATRPAESERYTGGVMRAVTMPGWELSRESLRDPIWRLTKNNEPTPQTMEFDRAGRLLRYGYPGRMIEIDYPRTNIDGASQIGEANPVIITDAATLRRLELYYNSEHRIVRTALRDLSAGVPADTSVCDPTANCHETRYTYTDGLLTEVTYWDGQTATYAYDPQTRQLLNHDDPRAPIAPGMRYAYDTEGNLATATIIGPDGAELPWRTLEVISTTPDQRRVQMTEHEGEFSRSRVYTYVQNAGRLRFPTINDDEIVDAANSTTTFALITESNPLAGTGDAFEDEPFEYLWRDGLLSLVQARVGRANEGRSSTNISYTRTGVVAGIGNSFRGSPEFRVRFTPTIDTPASIYRPETITYSDATTEQFTYDEQGRVATYIDRNGAEYDYFWQEDSSQPSEIIRRQDNRRWAYTYNEAGLVTQVAETTAMLDGEGTTAPYIINYTWDGLGHLIGIEDGVIGAYQIEYPVPDAEGQTEILVTDPIGVVTTTRFDVTSRLIAQETRSPEALLQATRYTYDIYNRLIEEAAYIGPDADDATLTEEAITRYDYQPAPTMIDNTGETITINGYQITITDPYQRQESYTYDALDRIRRTEDFRQQVTTYAYSTQDTGFNLGLRIIQDTRFIGTEIVQTAAYVFDTQRQLRTAQSGRREWVITARGEEARQRSLTTNLDQATVALREVVWGDQDYVNGRPPQVDIRQVGITLNSNFNVEASHEPSLGVTYDFAGRPTRHTDGNGTTTDIIYCPMDAGATRTVYGLPDVLPTCDGTDFALSLTHDPHGRVIQVTDSSGTRTLNYIAGFALWEVDVTFASGASGEQTTGWALQYDGLGQLVLWRDETGTLHNYTYDGLSRLLSVTVADQPEQSVTLSYNDADLLVEEIDGLGRGFRYSYDERGQVISQLNISTANPVSFSYTPTGMLSAIISPTGSTSIYSYTDPSDFTRITGIIDPTGSQYRYDWDDANNQLIYTNPFDDQTTYRYDGTESLWRIDGPLPINEAQNRSYEIHYDDHANPTDWRQDTRQGATQAAQHLVFNWEDGLNIQNGPNTGINLGRSLQFTPIGQLLAVDDLSFAYDALNRPLQITLGTQEAGWQFTWADQVPELTLLDGFGTETLLRFDSLYRLVSSTTQETTTTFTYQPGSEEDDSENAVQLTLDVPGSGSRTYIFSPGNNTNRGVTLPNVTVLASGQRVVYTYDAEGLLQQIQTEICSEAVEAFADCGDLPTWTTTVRFTYDGLGRPIRISDANGSTEIFTYDDVGDLVAYQNPNGRNFNYAYDSARRLTRVTTATGIKLLLAYDPTDQISGICRTRVEAPDDYETCAQNGGELLTLTYDQLGRPSESAYPVGGNQTATRVYDYGDFGLLNRAGEVSYRYDTFGLLDQVTINGQQTAFSYAGLNHLASAGDRGFTYDPVGRVSTMTWNGQAFNYAYAPDSYTIAGGGSELRYDVDARGLLAAIALNGTNQVEFQQRNRQIFPGWPTQEIQMVQDIALDGTVQGQTYVTSEGVVISSSQEIDAAGIIRRQTINSSDQEQFVLVLGYDEDERPLTTRLTGGGAVLYTQSFTYNEAGLKENESRRYADGTQITIGYRYGTGDQLLARVVTIIQPGNTLDATAFITLLLFVSFGALRRRRLLVGAVAVLVAGVLVTLTLTAQQASAVYTYTYAYDGAGNMQQITVQDQAEQTDTCATFTYDGANRLTTLSTPQQQFNYAYDTHNRLSSVDGEDIVYHSGSSQPMYMRGFYAQVADQLPIFAGTNWLLHDGYERVYQVYPPEQGETSTPWLFDPLGRYLSLAALPEDPCALDKPTQALGLQIHPLADGVLWDSRTGLSFVEGRAYEPQSGRFIQRDPAGVDALGMIYDGFPTTQIPYPQQAVSPYGEGLTVLRDALEATSINETLTAEAVRARYMPALLDTVTPLYRDLQAGRAAFDDEIETLLQLPTWLENQYNVPGAALDPVTGGVQVQLDAVPGHGGRGQPFDPGFQLGLPDWSVAVARASAGDVSTLFAGSITQHQRLYQSYVPPRAARPTLRETWTQPPTPSTAEPSAVLAWLPTTLEAPADAAYLFDALTGLRESLTTRPADWINDLLVTALPTQPALPPQTLADWRATWFRNDLFDLTGFPQQVIPDEPHTPLYGVRDTTDWLNILPD